MSLVALLGYVVLTAVIAIGTNRLLQATLEREVVFGGWVIGGLFAYLLYEFRGGDGGTVDRQYALVLLAFLVLLVLVAVVGGTMF